MLDAPLGLRLVALLSLLLLTSPSVAVSETLEGTVFVDADGDGVRGPGEEGRSGVRISNGREIVLTDAEGRYRLPAQGAGFAVVTCPADARCAQPFSRGSGDFALRPAQPAGDFFFVQVSDIHAYENPIDLAAMLRLDQKPWWMPRAVAGWLGLKAIERMRFEESREEIVAALRRVVSRHQDVEDAWDVEVVLAYLELAAHPASGVVRPGIEIPAALAEVGRLKPEIVLNTGDLILEGNDFPANTVEGWFDHYAQVARESGLPLLESIGNNDVGGTGNDTFTSADPRFGKAMFRERLGPTHYSFEYGRFHFTSIDTHRPEPTEDGLPGDPDGPWTFLEMDSSVRDWLDADLALAAASGKTLVALNHEPFYVDPRWEYIPDDYHAQDEGLFARHGVRYSLTGHMHRNGFRAASPEDPVTRITTGALSGFRWALPVEIDNRGYRLFHTRGGELYSAWKRTGEGVLAFIDPRGAAAAHPASRAAQDPGQLTGRVDLVAVAVDVDRPFTSVTLALDGQELALERWGEFFVNAVFEAAAVQASGSELVLRGVRADGSVEQTTLEVAAAR